MTMALYGGKPPFKWTAADKLAGLKEGWILTNDGSENTIVAKVDDPPAWPEHEKGLLKYDEPKFRTDSAAHAYVCKQAMRGKKHAVKALTFIGYAFP